MNQKILLATTNNGKLRELRSLLDPLPFTLLSPTDIGLVLDVPETGSTYAENAALKAKAFHSAAGLPVLADDTGLEVDARDARRDCIPRAFRAIRQPLTRTGAPSSCAYWRISPVPGWPAFAAWWLWRYRTGRLNSFMARWKGRSSPKNEESTVLAMTACSTFPRRV